MLSLLTRRRRTSPPYCAFRVFLLGILPLFAAVAAQAQATGNITGRVFNPATGEYVRNAEVRIEGTQQATFSEDGGFYRLPNAPVGEVTVVVSYTGYRTATAKVTVSADGTATKDFELIGTAESAPSTAPKPGDDVIALSEFVVSSEREGNAKAIQEQKAAMNIKTIVATDAFGDIAEGNIGEFLKFMPGITLDYVETDTRAARMGGMEARYGAVTLDGASMAVTGTGSFGDNSRQFEFEAVSINNIETIEVNKTLSADMWADAPAGLINLRTKSALDRKGRRTNYAVSVIGNQYEHSLSKTPRHDDTTHAKTRPAFSFDHSDSYFNNTLGIAINGGITDVYKEQFRTGLTYDYTSAQAIAAGKPLITAINFKDGPKKAEKWSAGVKLDYRPFQALTVTLSGSYISFTDEIANRNANFRVSAANVDPTSTMNRVIALPSGSNANTRIEHTGSHGQKETDTSNAALAAVYKKRSWTIDGQAAYSRARQTNGSDRMSAVATSNLNLTRIGWIAERSSVDSPAWTFTQTSGGAWGDLNNYGRFDAQAGNVGGGLQRGKAQQYTALVNAKKVMGWRLPTFFKSGLAVQQTVLDRQRLTANTRTFVGPTGNQLTSPQPISSADFRIAQAWGGNLYSLPVPNKAQIFDWLTTQPGYFTQTPAQAATDLDNILGSNQDITEQINAGYLMGNTRWKQWQFQLGGRFESTRTKVLIAQRVPDSANPFAANTLERIRYRWSLPRLANYGEYDDFMPSASAKWTITRDLNLKLGYHKAIKRAPLNRIGGLLDIDETNLEVTIPNPNLKPERSQRFSALLEYYYEPAGSLSLHLFQTDLTDPIDETSFVPASEFGFGDDPILQFYEFNTFQNRPGKRVIKGMELSYSQQLTFLPRLLSGTRVFATYTRVNSDPEPDDFVRQNASGGLFYRYKRFNASIAGTWTDEIKTGDNTVSATAAYFAGDREYLKQRFIFDVGAGFKINRYAELFISGRNAFNSGKTWYYKSDGRYRQMERYGGQWTVGVRGSF